VNFVSLLSFVVRVFKKKKCVYKKMSGHTFAIKQRPVVYSAIFDRFSIGAEKANRRNVNFDKVHIALYSAQTNNMDMSVDMGDILYMKNQYCSGSDDMGGMQPLNEGQSQQPRLLSSLNNFQCHKQVWKQFPKHMSESRRFKACVHHLITYMGVSRTGYTYDGLDLDQVGGLAPLLNGVISMFVNGPKAILPGDFIAYEAPLDKDAQCWDENDQGFSPTRKRLFTVPMRTMRGLTIDSLLEFVQGRCPSKGKSFEIWKQDFLNSLLKDDSFCSEGDYFIELRRVKPMELGAWTFDPLEDSLHMVYEGMKLRTDRVPAIQKWEAFKKQADLYLFSQREADMKNRNRVFAKCIRGAEPKSRMDALLF
jgi:hypothetical protein